MTVGKERWWGGREWRKKNHFFDLFIHFFCLVRFSPRCSLSPPSLPSISSLLVYTFNRYREKPRTSLLFFAKPTNTRPIHTFFWLYLFISHTICSLCSPRKVAVVEKLRRFVIVLLLILCLLLHRLHLALRLEEEINLYENSIAITKLCNFFFLLSWAHTGRLHTMDERCESLQLSRLLTPKH